MSIENQIIEILCTATTLASLFTFLYLFFRG